MKVCGANFLTVVWRLYLVMAIVLVAGFTGMWILAFLALPVFISRLLAISWSKPDSVRIAAPVHKSSQRQIGTHATIGDDASQAA